MANRVDSDSHHLSSPVSPLPSSKDMLGPDNPIPLSPQWLLPKQGDMKPEILPGPGETDPFDGSIAHFGNAKTSEGGSDVLGINKKNDIFRPSCLNKGFEHNNRWRDEERDISSSNHRENWSGGDKDPGDFHKLDRRVEISSTTRLADGRHGVNDKWADLSSKGPHREQRRESKWNSRWGPSEKGSEGLHDKWSNSSKDNESGLDKGLSSHSNHGKNEKEDYYRPWRSNSSQGRGRCDYFTSNKQGSTVTPGRTRSESGSGMFSPGRGRAGSGGSIGGISHHSQSWEALSEEMYDGSDENVVLRYSRTKLLDVYKHADLNSHKMSDGFMEADSITLKDMSEPLALFLPSQEESVIINGIRRGDITGSGAPQMVKDESLGRNPVDVVHPNLTNFDSARNNNVAADCQCSDESANGFSIQHPHYSRASSYDKMRQYMSNPTMETVHDGFINLESKPIPEGWRGDTHFHCKSGEFTKGLIGAGNSSSPPGTGRIAEMGQPQMHKQLSNDPRGGFSDAYYLKDEVKGQIGRDPVVGMHPSVMQERDHETWKSSLPAPEDLLLYYKDPQGEVQGPFPGSDIITWFESGYFGINLEVRLANAPVDSPFLLLGDVMPHLRAKARPPPGFSVSKHNESALNDFSRSHTGASEIDTMRNGTWHQQGSNKEAENRFLESLMSQSMNQSLRPVLTQGGHEQGVITANSIPHPLGDFNGNALHLLAQRLALERHRPLPSPFPNWLAREEPTPISGRVDVLPDSLSNSYAKLVSMMGAPPPPPQSQNVDLMSLICGLSDKQSPNIKNNLTGHDSFQDKISLNHGHNLPSQGGFGMQQPIMHQQNLQHLFTQPIDNPSGVLTLDKLLSSGAQDTQILSLLQQNYLMQPQQQTSPSPQQVQLLDDLLSEQHQKQKEKEQVIQRQQDLLSRVLSQHQFSQLVSGQLQTDAVAEPNISKDCVLQMTTTSSDENASKLINEAPQASLSFDSDAVMLLENLTQVKGKVPIALDKVNNAFQNDSHQVQKFDDGLLLSNEMDKCLQETAPSHKTVQGLVNDVSQKLLIGSEPASVASSEVNFSVKAFVKSNVNDAPTQSQIVVKEQQVESHELSTCENSRNVHVFGVKKPSDKKSRKHKSSKLQANLGQNNESPKAFFPEQTRQANVHAMEAVNPKAEMKRGASGKKSVVPPHASDVESISLTYAAETGEPQKIKPSSASSGASFSDEPKQAGSLMGQQTHTGQRAWIPGLGVRAKSLLEIQEEEQKKVKLTVSELIPTASCSSSSMASDGIVSSDMKVRSADRSPGNLNRAISENSIRSKVKNSELHTLLEEDIKCNEFAEVVEKCSNMPSLLASNSQVELIDDNEFIEAKDTKKFRKKAAKAKSAKGTVLPVSAMQSVASSPNEKGKTSRAMQQQEASSVPCGPSLVDFVAWKGESKNSAPASAWSTNSGKHPRSTSLRDIQEQQKNSNTVDNEAHISPPHRPQAAPAIYGSVSRSHRAASPPRQRAFMQSFSSPTSVKDGEEDDLFWGPMAGSKDEVNQANSSPVSSGYKGVKAGTSGRGHKKSIGNRPSERVLSASPASNHPSPLKGNGDAVSKYSEAMDFRVWCENECVRLTGTKDTSFLEFCLKQPRSEAEALLIENLGSFDPRHEFIDKFLNYMDLLPRDVIEIAFEGGSSGSIRDSGASVNPESSARGGKKKGKKGKKVSPTALGFNIVSNRIMRGEIQTVED